MLLVLKEQIRVYILSGIRSWDFDKAGKFLHERGVYNAITVDSGKVAGINVGGNMLLTPKEQTIPSVIYWLPKPN